MTTSKVQAYVSALTNPRVSCNEIRAEGKESHGVHKSSAQEIDRADCEA